LSRQFLAVEIPEQSEILSVVAQHKPVRAVRALVGGKTYNLIPLPEVSEGDLSFDVQMVIAGRLPGGSLPEGVRLLGKKVSLIAPQVVTWENDADYGIPIARTRWTVWFPKDEQVRVLTSAEETNLDQADEVAATVFERSALVDEAKQLLSVIESGATGNSADLAYGNLARLDKELSRDNDPSHQEVMRQIHGAAQRPGPGQKTGEPGKEASPQEKPLMTPDTQAAQAEDLHKWNSNAQKQSKAPSRGEFGFREQNGPAGSSDKPVIPFPLNLRRRSSAEVDKKEQESAQSDQRSDNKDQTFTEPKAADLEKQLGGLAQATQPPAPNERLQGLGQFGAPIFTSGNGMPVPAPAPALGPNNAEPGKSEKKDFSHPHSPGTLSLAFDIPKEGQRLVFTKAGGDPKLAVELRPRKSLEVLLGTLWMLPWIFLLLLAILLFGRNRYAAAAWRQLPFGLIAVGLLLFVVLPSPGFYAGLALVAAGTIQASVMRHRHAASR
jgi:hypothetical protein